LKPNGHSPIFSLCHPTARIPGGWESACRAWRDKCADPTRVEYVLSIHRRQSELGYEPFSAMKPAPFEDLVRSIKLTLERIWPGRWTLAVNESDPTMTNNANVGAAASIGCVLVDMNDDLYPCESWDAQLLSVIDNDGGLERDFVVKVSHGSYHPELITHPIVSRSYFEKIGPVDPAYLAYGADDDLTVRAARDGVVIDAPNILFPHLDWRAGQRPKDGIDEWNDRPEVWRARKDALKRHGRLAPLVAVCTPGASFSLEWRSAWDKLLIYLLFQYRLNLCYIAGNNIYGVRRLCAEAALNGPDREPPDYVLWIDSDNLPASPEGFESLMLTLKECPEIGGVAGWYRYLRMEPGPDGPDGAPVPYSCIAAGHDSDSVDSLVTEEEILASRDAGELLGPVAYSGFGFFLTRGAALTHPDLGPAAFDAMIVPGADGRPRMLTDDVSYCARMRAAGLPIYIHPNVFVEHEKSQHVRYAPRPYRAPARAQSISQPIPISQSISSVIVAGVSTQQKGEQPNGDSVNRGSQEEQL
jgi:GT2 family glycosyltransferase